MVPDRDAAAVGGIVPGREVGATPGARSRFRGTWPRLLLYGMQRDELKLFPETTVAPAIGSQKGE